VIAGHGRHLVSFGADYYRQVGIMDEDFAVAAEMWIRHKKWIRNRTQRGRETRGPAPRFRGRNQGHPWASTGPLERRRPPFMAIASNALQER
jgi:hypothetical protein